MHCWATPVGQVMVKSFDKMWSSGEGSGRPLHHSCLEKPMNSMKRQKDMTVEDELPRSVGERWTPQYATGEEWRNNSRRNEEAEPKQKQHAAVDVSSGESKAQCCKEQCCIENWTVKSMNQSKLQVVKQEMGKSGHRHFRNQWTKMDQSGWI